MSIKDRLNDASRRSRAANEIMDGKRSPAGLNERQMGALRSAISNAEEDLYRAKLQKLANRNWKSGNGESIDDVIAGYQSELDKLREGL